MDLDVTSPLRNIKDIKDSLNLFVKKIRQFILGKQIKKKPLF